ncbi:MAG: hypothetical protein IJJ33_06455 [Victivallales bacterium]|nr:hypothetical protein [Victivallales bacterium]
MRGTFNLIVIWVMCVSGIVSGGNDEEKGKQANQKKFEKATRLVEKAKRMVIGSECTDLLLWEANSFVEHVNGVLDSEEHSITDDLFEKRDYKVIYVDGNIASFRLEKTTYTGGMHPNMVVTVGTVVRGRKDFPLKLNDIMTPEQTSQMSALIRQALRRHFKVKTDKAVSEQMSCYTPKPIENFYYDAKGLHFVYNENLIIDVCIQWPRPLCALKRPEPNGKTAPKAK